MVCPVWSIVGDGGTMWFIVGIHFLLVSLVTLTIMLGKINALSEHSVQHRELLHI